MNHIDITAARCRGAVERRVCGERDSCARHLQLELDGRQQLDSIVRVQVMTLPRVGEHECHYRIPA